MAYVTWLAAALGVEDGGFGGYCVECGFLGRCRGVEEGLVLWREVGEWCYGCDVGGVGVCFLVFGGLEDEFRFGEGC